MSAFCLLQISVKDPVQLKMYTDAAPATVAPFGGALVFRGKVSSILSGASTHNSAVVIRFPDSASADSWYGSEGYQALLEHRNAGAEVVVTRYDEGDFF